MSTATKRALKDALKDAEAFRSHFAGCYDRWEIAGSIRRGKPEVGDIEHVVIPKWAEMPNPLSMFGESVLTNLLWMRLDSLIAAGTASRHQYETNFADGTVGTRERWGNFYRGVDYRDFNHEIFCADEQNWGCILAIRTGPADFSQRMVTALHGTMLRQKDGYLRYDDGKIYACPDERAFFAACRQAWAEPKDRT